MGLDVRQALLDFYNTYYSANQMTLAISGRGSLDTLQRWAIELFSPVPNKNVMPAEAAYAGRVSPIQPGTEDELWCIVPLKDTRSLDLTWQVPFTSASDRDMRILGKPHQVIGALACMRACVRACELEPI